MRLGKKASTGVYFYILWEHISSENRFVLLNLLGYMAGIWRRHLELNKGAENLPPILPVVLMQNAERWEEWIGKIQMLEQFLGNVVTAKEAFEGRDLRWLEARFLKLENEYNLRHKGRE